MTVMMMFALLMQGEKLQEDGAAWLKKMEAALTKAKTIKGQFTVQIDAEESGTFDGTVAVAEGNKIRLAVEGTLEGRTRSTVVVSDGKSMSKDEDDETFEPPSKLSQHFPVMLARPGLFLGMDGIVPTSKHKKVIEDPVKEFEITEAKLGDKQKVGDVECQTVSYCCTVKGTEVKVTVWIDVKRHLPLKRVIKVEKRGSEGTVTETFQELLLDEKIEDKTFQREKK